MGGARPLAGTGLAASPQAVAGRERGTGAPRVTWAEPKRGNTKTDEEPKGSRMTDLCSQPRARTSSPFFLRKYIFPSVAY